MIVELMNYGTQKSVSYEVQPTSNQGRAKWLREVSEDVRMQQNM
jgi:hypothetical protein